MPGMGRSSQELLRLRLLAFTSVPLSIGARALEEAPGLYADLLPKLAGDTPTSRASGRRGSTSPGALPPITREHGRRGFMAGMGSRSRRPELIELGLTTAAFVMLGRASQDLRRRADGPEQSRSAQEGSRGMTTRMLDPGRGRRGDGALRRARPCLRRRAGALRGREEGEGIHRYTAHYDTETAADSAGFDKKYRASSATVRTTAQVAYQRLPGHKAGIAQASVSRSTDVSHYRPTSRRRTARAYQPKNLAKTGRRAQAVQRSGGLPSRDGGGADR